MFITHVITLTVTKSTRMNIFLVTANMSWAATSPEILILRDPVRERFCLLHILTFSSPGSILIWSHLWQDLARDLWIKFPPDTSAVACLVSPCGMHVQTVRSFCMWSPHQCNRTKQTAALSCESKIFISTLFSNFYICIFHFQQETKLYIQGVSRLVDITAGGDLLGLCHQKSSYKHVSDFGQLRIYDRMKLRRWRLLTVNETK
jgi:hypothetical protein